MGVTDSEFFIPFSLVAELGSVLEAGVAAYVISRWSGEVGEAIAVPDTDVASALFVSRNTVRRLRESLVRAGVFEVEVRRTSAGVSCVHYIVCENSVILRKLKFKQTPAQISAESAQISAESAQISAESAEISADLARARLCNNIPYRTATNFKNKLASKLASYGRAPARTRETAGERAGERAGEEEVADPAFSEHAARMQALVSSEDTGLDAIAAQCEYAHLATVKVPMSDRERATYGELVSEVWRACERNDLERLFWLTFGSRGGRRRKPNDAQKRILLDYLRKYPWEWLVPGVVVVNAKALDLDVVPSFIETWINALAPSQARNTSEVPVGAPPQGTATNPARPEKVLGYEPPPEGTMSEMEKSYEMFEFDLKEEHFTAHETKGGVRWTLTSEGQRIRDEKRRQERARLRARSNCTEAPPSGSF